MIPLITITPVKVAKTPQEVSDFLISLRTQASKDACYRVSDRLIIGSKIQIFLPDDCLVMGNSWDKYIEYALEHGGKIDADFIVRRFGLRFRSGTIPDGISVRMNNGVMDSILGYTKYFVKKLFKRCHTVN